MPSRKSTSSRKTASRKRPYRRPRARRVGGDESADGAETKPESLSLRKIVDNIITLNKKKETAYAILGISNYAESSAIKKAYYSLSRRLHPDRRASTDNSDVELSESDEAFKIVSNSYEKLKDDATRKKYDSTLNDNRGFNVFGVDIDLNAMYESRCKTDVFKPYVYTKKPWVPTPGRDPNSKEEQTEKIYWEEDEDDKEFFAKTGTDKDRYRSPERVERDKRVEEEARERDREDHRREQKRRDTAEKLWREKKAAEKGMGSPGAQAPADHSNRPTEHSQGVGSARANDFARDKQTYNKYTELYGVPDAARNGAGEEARNLGREPEKESRREKKTGWLWGGVSGGKSRKAKGSRRARPRKSSARKSRA